MRSEIYAADVIAVPVTAERAEWPARYRDYVALTKPRLNLLVLATTLAGVYLGAPGGLASMTLLHTIVGTALVAGGAAALNQVWERDTDRLMRRTRSRPLPSGRLGAAEGTWFGLLLASGGLVELALAVNVLCASVALATLATYILVYTPLKSRTPLSTLVGAVPGALPPVIGWSAATGEISLPALVLFAIVFFWQLPHFLAIAWLVPGRLRARGDADSAGCRARWTAYRAAGGALRRGAVAGQPDGARGRPWRPGVQPGWNGPGVCVHLAERLFRARALGAHLATPVPVLDRVPAPAVDNPPGGSTLIPATNDSPPA